MVTGATASLSELELFDSDGKFICKLDNDEVTLGSCQIENGFKIHVCDS